MMIKALLITLGLFSIFILMAGVLVLIGIKSPVTLLGLIGVFVFGILFRVTLDVMGGK